MKQIPGALLCTLALASVVAPGSSGAAETKDSPAKKTAAKFELIQLRGSVVSYKQALEEKLGITLVESWGEDLYALFTDDGRVLPILPTEGARFFYKDERARHRPMEVTARVYEKTPGLQVIEVRSIKEGKLQEIYYWCDICSIKMYYLKDCDCCQGIIELREHPVGEPFRIQNRPQAKP